MTGPVPVQPGPDLLDLAEALAGADLAAEHGDDWWRAGAMAAVETLADSGRIFTSEDLVAVVGEPQGTQNQLGAVFLTASRRGTIVCVGAVRSARPGRKAGLVRQWVGAQHAHGAA